jgi:hypothetical protein
MASPIIANSSLSPLRLCVSPAVSRRHLFGQASVAGCSHFAGAVDYFLQWQKSRKPGV